MNPFLLLAAVPMMVANPGSIAGMRWERRILLVSAPAANDAALVAQRNIVARWKAGAEARDLSLIEIAGKGVTGATDTADVLRHKYRLPADRFSVVLIGKDGGEKLRRSNPLPSLSLEETIDAMPMRRNGER